MSTHVQRIAEQRDEQSWVRDGTAELISLGLPSPLVTYAMLSQLKSIRVGKNSREPSHLSQDLEVEKMPAVEKVGGSMPGGGKNKDKDPLPAKDRATSR